MNAATLSPHEVLARVHTVVHRSAVQRSAVRVPVYIDWGLSLIELKQDSQKVYDNE